MVKCAREESTLHLPGKEPGALVELQARVGVASRDVSPTTEATIIGDEVRTVEATVRGEQLLVAPDQLAAATGWKLEPQGLCRRDVCVPVRDQAALLDGGLLDLAAVASALGRLAVVDAGARVLAMGADPATRKQALSASWVTDFATR